MLTALSFGAWLKQRRRQLDFTQAALAALAHCSAESIKKIEAGDQRPSRELAALLSDALAVPAHEREAFVRFARAKDATADARTFSRADASAAALAHVPGAHSSLPRPLTAFVGREREVQTLSMLLRRPDVALVTLSGPPGAGKTRLSLAVAEQLQASFADGAWFVPLAAIREPALVLHAIVAVLGVRESAQQSLLAATVAHLRDKELLLVLDNFEQVIAGVSTISELLGGARGLKALVTSRELSRLYGEHDFPVPPLSLPDLKQLPSPDALTTYSSVELFLKRAQAAQHDFALTADNAAAVAQICGWLDGLPLAIEMAAARVKWYAPQELLKQISQRLALLSEGPRDLTPRQQSLHGAIEWSYELLAGD